MFDVLRSASAKRRAAAKSLIDHAGKVLRYRRDLLSESAVLAIRDACSALKASVEGPGLKDESGYTAAADALDTLLRRHGGAVYPLGSFTDWVETFIIAAILAGGVRVYVFQPFKIPTNSMYPTYHGMVAKVYAPEAPAPTSAERAVRKVTLGATHFAPVAPIAGEVLIPLNMSAEPTRDDGWFGSGLLRSPAHAHPLLVGTPESTREVRVVLPADFSSQFVPVLMQAYFPMAAALPMPDQYRWAAVLAKAESTGDIVTLADGGRALRTHRLVGAGEPLLRFDINTGDLVIVDRMSYHFGKPAVGDSFVFRTAKVPGMAPMDQFYIKRLVGEGGDTLRVAEGKLWRNGSPAAGNAGFDNNNAHATAKGYFGYLPATGAAYALDSGYTVPVGHFWAMGDNSANSQDSRYFGPVPENAVVGRALVILHPFSERVGRAK